MRQKIVLLLFFGCFSLWSLVDGHSRGAPCSVISERNLQLAPQHGRRPQTSPSPFSLSVSQNGFEANDTLRVNTYYKITIDYDQQFDTLAGFLIRAVWDKNPGKIPEDAGAFSLHPRSCARYIKCSQGSFITHKRPRLCRSHSFTWLAPKEAGEYVYFQATGVLSYKDFWTNIRTKTYKMDPGPTTTTTTTTVKTTTPKATTTPKPTTPTTTKKRTTTTNTFPPTTTLEPLTTPPYDPACEPDGPDCLIQLRRDLSRKFCEIEGWQDYCPQLCCYKVKGEKRPDFLIKS